MGDSGKREVWIGLAKVRSQTPEMMNVPTWGWHALKGELAGHHAVWVSKNWRMTFKFEDEDAVRVDYQDYH
jgi:proteic killer suppression protein